ncbi:type II toxin-antitoxin system death-on-curing family toxin [Clostridium tyrobutyricum]|uniref:type II toxin-antitoxin system death-on-curing family toxin n=1 Tax=Clostridium tyrobutyricum TaxID=1519 RepID=UPI001C380D65|nr:type II toxin-antitoxin system death-on-curing family toxin [Clostridium tyrobutyricum]MBV4417955.1 type II toxin-antitoxin system death-on-curing family toxin [Clostridium tyrobutyricum]
MKYIFLEYIIKLHDKMIDSTGGSKGIRDIELLKSSIENSRATFGGQDLYPTAESKCANICFNIIKNHAFVDCNKRTGIYVMLMLLEYNNIKLEFTQKELVDLGVNIASGKLNQKDIIYWIKNHK